MLQSFVKKHLIQWPANVSLVHCKFDKQSCKGIQNSQKNFVRVLEKNVYVKLIAGQKCIIRESEEQDLVSRIIRLQKVGFPLTKDDVR